MPATIPHLIPVADPFVADVAVVGDPAMFSSYEVAFGGLGFRLASDSNKPLLWETAPYVRQQIDQGSEAGEQTLTNWWVKSQSSFHGGAGNLNLERVDLPAEYTHIRFDQSKNVDCWTPGVLKRLPDTTLVTADRSASMVGIAVSGADRAVYVDQAGGLKLLDPAGPTTTPFTAVTDLVLSVCTDGQRAYAASTTGVWRVDPTSTGTAVKIASYAAVTSAVVGWVKGRLMVAAGQSIYEIDSTTGVTVAVGAGQLRYTHPTPGWVWRCFASAPASILAAGDAGLRSEIVEFTLAADGGTPVLTVSMTAAVMPPGERVLSMETTMGSFLAIGTTAGIRIGEIGNPYSLTALTYGPLTLPASETQFQVGAVAFRDRFVYASGLAVDEPGLIRVDLGTQTDQPGRHAWATDLIGPTTAGTGVATGLCSLPSGRLLFSIPSVGIVFEGAGPGSVRDAWLRTSHIRYGTTEPKLFKLGRIRGALSSGSVRVESVTRDTSTLSALIGGLDPGVEPDEFGLPTGRQEWLALKFTLIGAAAQLASYGVKALPGTKRQRMIQVTCAVADRETDRHGHKTRDIGSARTRVEALFDLDAAGDEVLFEEFGIYGNKRTLVVIEKVQFAETARPTATSDFGGTVTVTLRTVT